MAAKGFPTLLLENNNCGLEHEDYLKFSQQLIDWQLEDGTTYAWGMGTNLQLTNGSEDDEWEPIPVSGKQLEGKEVKIGHRSYRTK